jgi:hypothetical protein
LSRYTIQTDAEEDQMLSDFAAQLGCSEEEIIERVVRMMLQSWHGEKA